VGPRSAHELFQPVESGAGVDRLLGEADAVPHRFAHSGRGDGSAGVEQHRAAPDALLSAQDLAEQRRVAIRIAAAQILDRAAGHAQLLGRDLVLAHAAPADLGAPERQCRVVLDVEEVWLVETDAISEIQPEAVVETSAALRADVSLIDTEPTSDWPIWHPLAEAEIPAQDSLVPEALVKEPALAVPLTSRSKIAFREQGPQVVPLMQNAVPVRPNTYRQRLLQKAIVQNDEVFWKTATALAMVAVAALLVGASANRFSPLPANVVQRSIEAQQPVPFEKARIVPALPLDAGNKIGALPSAQGSDVARFHPALAIEPAAPRIVPETADRANDRLLRTKPRHHSAGHLESDMVAEDTVVRYDKKHPPASRTQAQKNSGVRQYSDLD